MAAQNKLNIFGGTPLFDKALVSLDEIIHTPYCLLAYNPSNKIRIDINYQDLILDIAGSFLYIEGTFADKNATKLCYFNTALAFFSTKFVMNLAGKF